MSKAADAKMAAMTYMSAIAVVRMYNVDGKNYEDSTDSRASCNNDIFEAKPLKT